MIYSTILYRLSLDIFKKRIKFKLERNSIGNKFRMRRFYLKIDILQTC